MGHGDDRAFVLLKVVLQPGNGFSVQVVGRLVEEQNIGFGEQESGECDAPLFAARKDFNRRIRRGTAQRLHRHFQMRI